jgi:hypothetical protein
MPHRRDLMGAASLRHGGKAAANFIHRYDPPKGNAFRYSKATVVLLSNPNVRSPSEPRTPRSRDCGSPKLDRAISGHKVASTQIASSVVD